MGHTDIRIEGLVAILSLRSEPVNALSKGLREEVMAHLEEWEHDERIHCIVFTSLFKVFAAGADLGEIAAIEGQFDAAAQFSREIQGFIRRLEACPKPLIAALTGHALGGGLELALCCDLRIALANARYGFPEVGLGLIPAGGGNAKLPALVGGGKASELILTGKVMDGLQGQTIGLFNDTGQTPDEVLEKALLLAHAIAQNGPRAVRTAKQILNTSIGEGVQRGLAEEESRFPELLVSPEAAEGIQAFLNKRPPAFTGGSS